LDHRSLVSCRLAHQGFIRGIARSSRSSFVLGCFFGLLWGLASHFGLTMRFWGLSLGMAMVLGLCAAFGTLMHPFFSGEFHEPRNGYYFGP